MSNTGFKGVTRIDSGQGTKHEKHGYQVYVGWRGRELRQFLSDEEYGLGDAVLLRNALEHDLEKPRAEVIIRSFGTTPNGTWTRLDG